jgi:phosphoglycolate phosphatase
MKSRLVLFDVDGTLIRDHGAAREAFSAALREVFDYVPPLDAYDFSGRTDPEITLMVLEHSGIEPAEIERAFEALWKIYLAGLRRRIDDRSVSVMPGIPELLETLDEHPAVTLALLTGNIEPGARTKLSPYDLNRFFPFGAFGSDSRFRVELPPLAVRRAEEHCGIPFALSDVVLIGDSIYDVRCAVPHGVRSIAVATGVTSAEDLQRENPDFFFETLENTDEVVEVIFG